MGHGFVQVKPSLCLSGMIPLLSHFLYSLTFICDSAFLASKMKPILSLIQMNTAAKPSNALGPRSQSQEMGTLPARSPAAANHLPEGGLTATRPPRRGGWGDRRHHLSPENRQPPPQHTNSFPTKTRTFDRRRPQTINIRLNHIALPFLKVTGNFSWFYLLQI